MNDVEPAAGAVLLEPFLKGDGQLKRASRRLEFGSKALGAMWAWEVARLYGFPTTTADGTGQKIAIVELGGGYRTVDLLTYFNRSRRRVPVVRAISVDGATNAPTGDYTGPDGEVCLDIELAGSVASGAQLWVYFAPNTLQGFYNAIARAVADRPCAISISWGLTEDYWPRSALRAFDALFAQAASLRIAVLCASGDGGSGDGVADGQTHVDFPSSSPNVTACGGTSLDANSTRTAIVSERAWGGGGGGVSRFFPRPSYQRNLSTLNRRRTPDVSGNADPASGYPVVVDGRTAVYGGTSAVAPLIAGLVALVSQTNRVPCGFLNTALYTNGATLCRDVLQGSNGAYSAAPGYDLTSGWGSPKGEAWSPIYRTSGTPHHRFLSNDDPSARDPRPVWLRQRAAKWR